MLEHGRGGGRVAAQPELEPVLDRILDQPRGLGRDQPLLGLALELRLAEEQGQEEAGAAGGVLGGDGGRPLEADPLGMGAQALEQRGAQARLVGAAQRRRHGVAVPAGVGLLVDRPGDCPLDAGALLQRGLAGERVVHHQLAAVQQRLEEIGEPLREMEALLGRHRRAGLEQRRITAPANLDAAEQIGLAARHPVQGGRAEARRRAEDLRVGDEAHRRPATVGGTAGRGNRAQGHTARIALDVERPIARDLDHKLAGERVDHGHADTMQAAGSLVHLAAELPARMQRGHDDLERTLVGKLGVRVDRDAAAIVAHGDSVGGGELELDARGVARHGLVHGVVQHLGHEVVQRALVGPADIHARPPPHRLQPLQHLDVVRRIALAAAVAGEIEQVRHAFRSDGQDCAGKSAVAMAMRTAALMVARGLPRQAVRQGSLEQSWYVCRDDTGLPRRSSPW